MGISTALSNAAAGLAASSRLADTISNNVANAMTEGYARRTTELSSVTLNGYGSGVRVSGTLRAQEPFLTAERRGADAAVGAGAVRADAWERLMAAVGEPGEAASLSTLATGLETALMGATASPQSTAKLAAAVEAAKSLAGAVNRIAAENARVRTEADAEIARQVGQVNDALVAVQDLNRKIASLTPQGIDTNALQDERARLIDSVSAIVPVRTVARDNGQLAIYTQNGGLLLDGEVHPLAFTAAGTVIAGMAVGAGLSGLSQDQGAASGPVAIDVGSGARLMDGGSLAALFEVRDAIAPGLDAEMDRYAGELIARFRDLMPAGALDASGDGLFVDAGGGGTTGLAGRLAVNAAVDPEAGGEVWRLRAGLAATTAGDEGFGTYLQGLSDAMAAARTPAGFVSQTAQAGAATMASEIGAFFANRAAASDTLRATATARQTLLAEQEAHATGVDTDAELQALMLVEQAYAANARVLSVIDSLMQILLEA